MGKAPLAGTQPPPQRAWKGWRAAGAEPKPEVTLLWGERKASVARHGDQRFPAVVLEAL